MSGVAMETVSDERLAKMLAGLEGVTPGPWSHHAEIDGTSRFTKVKAGKVTLARTQGMMGRPHVDSADWEPNAAHIARLDPDTVRSIISELLASRLAKQGPAWQTTEPPKDGTPVYIRTVRPYRYLPYKPTSQQYKRGEKGRWQVMNEYGGWENSHPLGNEWRLDSPFSSPSPVGGSVS